MRFMKWAVIFIAVLGLVARSDDTIPFRNVLKGLCAVNREGKFAECCEKYEDGKRVTLEYVPRCFVTIGDMTMNDEVTELFVHASPRSRPGDGAEYLSLSPSLVLHSDFFDVGLTSLGDNILSQLTQLQNLFVAHPSRGGLTATGLFASL